MFCDLSIIIYYVLLVSIQKKCVYKCDVIMQELRLIYHMFV